MSENGQGKTGNAPLETPPASRPPPLFLLWASLVTDVSINHYQSDRQRHLGVTVVSENNYNSLKTRSNRELTHSDNVRITLRFALARG